MFRAPVRALSGGCEIAQAEGELPQGVVADLLAARQIQVLQRQTGSERGPAAPEEESQHWGKKHQNKEPPHQSLERTVDMQVKSGDTSFFKGQRQDICYISYLSNATSVTSVCVRSRWVMLGQRLRI